MIKPITTYKEWADVIEANADRLEEKGKTLLDMLDLMEAEDKAFFEEIRLMAAKVNETLDKVIRVSNHPDMETAYKNGKFQYFKGKRDLALEIKEKIGGN